MEITPLGEKGFKALQQKNTKTLIETDIITKICLVKGILFPYSAARLEKQNLTYVNLGGDCILLYLNFFVDMLSLFITVKS